MDQIILQDADMLSESVDHLCWRICRPYLFGYVGRFVLWLPRWHYPFSTSDLAASLRGRPDQTLTAPLSKSIAIQLPFASQYFSGVCILLVGSSVRTTSLLYDTHTSQLCRETSVEHSQSLWSGRAPSSTETQREAKWPKSGSKATPADRPQSDLKLPQKWLCTSSLILASLHLLPKTPFKVLFGVLVGFVGRTDVSEAKMFTNILKFRGKSDFSQMSGSELWIVFKARSMQFHAPSHSTPSLWNTLCAPETKLQGLGAAGVMGCGDIIWEICVAHISHKWVWLACSEVARRHHRANVSSPILVQPLLFWHGGGAAPFLSESCDFSEEGELRATEPGIRSTSVFSFQKGILYLRLASIFFFGGHEISLNDALALVVVTVVVMVVVMVVVVVLVVVVMVVVVHVFFFPLLLPRQQLLVEVAVMVVMVVMEVMEVVVVVVVMVVVVVVVVHVLFFPASASPA